MRMSGLSRARDEAILIDDYRVLAPDVDLRSGASLFFPHRYQSVCDILGSGDSFVYQDESVPCRVTTTHPGNRNRYQIPATRPKPDTRISSVAPPVLSSCADLTGSRALG